MAPKKKKIPKPAPKPKDTSKKKKKDIPAGFAIKSKPKKTKIKISGRTVTPGVLNLRDKIKKLKQKKVQKTNQVQLNPPNNFQNWGQFIEKLPYGVADQIVGDVFQDKKPAQLGDVIRTYDSTFPGMSVFERDMYGNVDFEKSFSTRDLERQKARPLTGKQKQRYKTLNSKESRDFRQKGDTSPNWGAKETRNLKKLTFYNPDFTPAEKREMNQYKKYMMATMDSDKPMKLVKPPKRSKESQRDREFKLLQEMNDSKF